MSGKSKPLQVLKNLSFINYHLGKMETIFHNPGLQHLAENILCNLDVEDLQMCGLINQYLKQILENPMLWLQKFVGLSKENEQDWIKVIQLAKNSDKEKSIISYLQWNLKKDASLDLPCYSSPVVQNEFRRRIRESCKKRGPSDEDTEIVKILAPLTDNPNAPDNVGWTPIHSAAFKGHTEIVKILLPFTDNPNAPNKYGETPIHEAAHEGHTDIVKILAPLSGNNSRKRKLDLEHQRKKPRN